MNYKYVPIDRILSKLSRDYTSGIPEGDVIEWAGEALEFIGASRYYEEAVAFVEVKNHQCDIPKGTHAIIQIARNNAWQGPKDNSLCPMTVATILDLLKEQEESTPVALDPEGMPMNAYDVAYYRPYFDLKCEYFNWRKSDIFRGMYTPVRLKSASFFDTLVCATEDDNPRMMPGQQETDQYTIIRGEKIRFNFQAGSVAIAYSRQILDPETGWPMIPDNISYTTAITKYIIMKVMEKKWLNGRETKENLDKMERDWHWYCKQASNIDLMPHGIDEHQNLLEQRSYLLPRQNQYYGFFGALGKGEDRRYNNPVRR